MLYKCSKAETKSMLHAGEKLRYCSCFGVLVLACKRVFCSHSKSYGSRQVPAVRLLPRHGLLVCPRLGSPSQVGKHSVQVRTARFPMSNRAEKSRAAHLPKSPSLSCNFPCFDRSVVVNKIRSRARPKRRCWERTRCENVYVRAQQQPLRDPPP